MSRVFKKGFHILFFIVCVCLALGLTLSACNENKAKTSHTLTFVADGNVVATLTGEAGSDVEIPPAPEKGNFDFVGWFDDPSFGDDAKQPSTVMPDRDVTYYAKYAGRVGYTIQYYLQKLNADQSAASDEYELSGETDSFEGTIGSTVSAPETLNYAPTGFVRATNQNEKLSLTLDADESKNILKVYFDRIEYEVSFDANGGEGEMESLSYPYGAIVSPNFQNEFTRDGYRFAGFVGTLANGEAAPTVSFTISNDVKYTAQWDRGYKNSADANDVVYFDGENYYRVVSGDIEKAETTYTMQSYGFDEFIFENADDTQKVCRLYPDSDTFVVRGEEVGSYVLYNYVVRDFDGSYVLSLDGFGTAAYTYVLQSGGQQNVAGTYFFDEEYSEWIFTYAEQPDSGFYFDLQDDLPANVTGNEQIAGSFVMHGNEEGEFVRYDMLESEVYDSEILQLFGNGVARIMAYDPNTQDYTQLLSQGTYYGTANYDDYFGEWQYQPTTGEGFKFVTNSIAADGQTLPIYIEYEEKLDKTLNQEGGNGKLMIGGYNGAQYTPTGSDKDIMSGAIEVLEANVLRFVPYDEFGDAGEPITFDINWADGTFSVNTTGLIVDENGVLTGYTGTSTVIVIPDNVTSIADNALNYHKGIVDLMYVTIPASVTSIGALAFENYYTLMSVVFESETPIEINWSSDADPFRWPAEGAFKIFVPNDALEAYKAAWTDCKYTITSVEEDSEKPEFEVDENGALLSYNCKIEDPQDLEIVLPSEVKSVAANVFKNLAFIASVDLNNATELGASAFEGCTGLTSIKADNLEIVGEAAFALCTSLTSINLPKVKTISAEAFAACESLEKVSVGASIERIGDSAFSECATLELYTLFVLELADGAKAPQMGSNVFYACFGYRVSVATVEDAIALYDSAILGWTQYAGRASVRANEQSELAGDWIDLETLLPVTIGGRIETTYDAFVYSLSGEELTLYYYSYSQLSGSVDRATVKGSYKGGRISFEQNGTRYVFARREGTLTYTSNANEALVIDFDTYKVEEIEDAEGFAPTTHITVSATFAGQAGTIAVTGNRLTMDNMTVDGKKCVLSFTLYTDGTYRYSALFRDVRGPYSASDGSYVKVVTSGTSAAMLYLTGSLMEWKNMKGEPIVLDDWSTTWYVGAHYDDTYIVRIRSWNNNIYFITVVIDESTMTFTYSIELGETCTTLVGNDGARVIVMRDMSGAITTMSLLVPGGEGNTETLYVREFTLGGDGAYTVEAEQRQMVYDEATGGYVTQLGPLSGVYKLTLDLDKGTCTVLKEGPLPAED